MTRWRPCGTPVKRESTSRYAQRYPSVSTSSTRYRMASPLLSTSMLRTFSSISSGTRRPRRSRNTSATSPDASPAIPCIRPAWVRSVQGKPAATKSTSGRRSRSRTSPTKGTPANRLASTACAGAHDSHSNSVLAPASCRPSSIPPMPANKPATLSVPRVVTPFKLHACNSALAEAPPLACTSKRDPATRPPYEAPVTTTPAEGPTAILRWHLESPPAARLSSHCSDGEADSGGVL